MSSRERSSSTLWSFAGWVASATRAAWLLVRLVFGRFWSIMASPEKNVLNIGTGSDEDTSSKHRPAEVVASDMQRFMLRLKGSFMQEDGRGVDYGAMKDSSDFAEFKTKCKELRGVDIASLDDDNKMAFFLNLYNALTIHGLASLDSLPSSVLEVQNFWSLTCYDIGGNVYSLDDIEHGILRGNRPHPTTKQALFAGEDPRLAHVMDNVDPRIHFALVCGAKSCPPINVYSANNLNFGLTAAARNFCEGEIRVEDGKVSMSKIFLWYGNDFGKTDAEKLRWCMQFLPETAVSRVEALLEKSSPDSDKLDFLTYHDYNWAINGKSLKGKL